MKQKTSGLLADFAPILDEGTHITICYGLIKASGELYEWWEIYLPKKQNAQLTFQVVKDAIIKDINARTDDRILSGFSWNDKPVWLSEENQKNFSEAQRIADMTDGQSLPVKFKLGEDENGSPVYHTFTTVNAIRQFYLSGVAFIQQCLADGWAEKDGIDWAPYEEYFQTDNDE